MSITLLQLAELVQGTLHGDPDLVPAGARPLGEARAGDITFLEHEKYANQLQASAAAAAVVPVNFTAAGKSVIQVADPIMAFAVIFRHLQKKDEAKPSGIDALACVHATARIGAEPSIHPLAVVGAGTVIGARCRIHSGAVVGANCTLGDDVVLHPNAVLYDDTVLGDRVIVHGNAVLGADGFGYRFQGGRHVKVPQLGHVEVGSDVEIGACTTIDRGAFTATRIGEGSKIDNLVQVAHNCQIGKHNLLVSQMGIAGSSSTGDYVVVAGQVGICDHVHIGAGAMIGAKAGVTKEVPAGQRMLGAPATPEREQKKILMSLEKLPEMRKDIRKIKQHLGMNEAESEAA
ncbi:MAG: UDP-3-O-(3-hydroxymyristoyl)glucosamine N-acyltransferase [Gemmataceae bacterium]